MIIGSLVSIAIFIYLTITDDHDFSSIAINILFCLIIFCSCLLITGIIGGALPEEEFIYKETSLPIISLEDNIGHQGKFFLGTGIVHEHSYYYFVLKTDRGFKIKNVSAEDAYVRYDSQPRIVIKQAIGFKHWYNYIWAIPIKSQNIIYVPEDTIISNYSIDLQ